MKDKLKIDTERQIGRKRQIERKI